MVCLSNICINTLNKGGSDDDDDDKNNNNNNSSTRSGITNQYHATKILRVQTEIYSK
jgi:hypothetical protein